ncbi:helix-turn-helix domain-containing protein [Cupriavidus sp. 30B13]|uniref:helix-turn-helix domain-containing protein n=1 Tax=Cupriavidus sp. 30B13 TaxID=3384241 RepID=UPI003B9157E6
MASATEMRKADVAARLKEARQFLGLSQQKLADKFGISKPGLQGNEAGKSMPGGDLLACYSSLGISVDWLLTGKGSMTFDDSGERAQPSAGPLDVELLEVVLEKLETKIAAAGVRASAKKKAELAALLYDYIVETGKAEGPSVERILRLVA